MKIKYTVLGPFMTNTYIVYNEKTMEGLVVDPSFTPEHYIHAILQDQIELRSIFLTHAHVDHMAGMNALRARFPKAELYMEPRGRLVSERPLPRLYPIIPRPRTRRGSGALGERGRPYQDLRTGLYRDRYPGAYTGRDLLVLKRRRASSSRETLFSMAPSGAPISPEAV